LVHDHPAQGLLDLVEVHNGHFELGMGASKRPARGRDDLGHALILAQSFEAVTADQTGGSRDHNVSDLHPHGREYEAAHAGCPYVCMALPRPSGTATLLSCPGEMKLSERQVQGREIDRLGDHSVAASEEQERVGITGP